MKAAFLSVLAALAAFTACAKQTLVAEYIVPVSQIDNWNYSGKIFNGYNTADKKGFTFTRRGPTSNGNYNYYLPALGVGFNALGTWVRPATDQSRLPASYTRSIASPGSPSHRYFYALHGTSFELVDKPSAEVLGGPGEIASAVLESVVIQKGWDSSVVDPCPGDETYACYVQCLHSNYVYDVTFKANGGSGADYTQPITNSAALVANRFTRTGYSFANWNTQADGKGTSYKDGVEIAPTDDMTLYAQWTGTTYTVTFNPNGGNLSGESSKQVTFGKSYGSMPSVSLEGHNCEVWYTAKDGGVKVDAGSVVNIAGNHTLYAHIAKNKYNLTINRGTGIASVRYSINNGEWIDSKGGAIPVDFNSTWKVYGIAETGYISNTSEQNPMAGTMPSSDISYTLTATETQYTVTYRPGERGVGQEYADKRNFTQTMTLRGSTYSRTGYTQSGWSQTDGGSKDFNLGAAYDGHVDMTLYPFWTPITYEVHYNPGGGTGEMANSAHTYDEPKALTSNAYVRTGHSFDGWVTNGSSVVAFADGASVKNLRSTSGTFNLYAHWTANTYMVTFDAMGGSVSPMSKSVTYGGTYGDLPTPEKPYKTFAGWYTSKSGGTQIKSGTTVTTAGSHTLHARWTDIIVTVDFDATGGSVSPTSKSATYGGAYGDLPTPAKKYKVFAGWYTSASGGTEVTSSTEVPVSIRHTIYAHWDDINVTVTFDAMGGSVSPTSKSVTYGGTYGDLPSNAAKTGYTFAQWHTAAVAGSRVYNYTTVSISSDHSIYAHWTTNQYTVVYCDDGGSTLDEHKFYYDRPQALRTAAELGCEKEGCDFVGWSTNETERAVVYRDGETVVNLTTKNGAYVALFPVWSPSPSFVVFDPNGGAGTMSVQECVCTLKTNLLPCAYQRAGYSFKRWASTPQDGIPRYADKAAYTPSAAYAHKTNTLYAIWSANYVDLTFEGEGGVFTNGLARLTIPDRYIDGFPYGEFPVVTNAHPDAVFIGWWTDTNVAERVQHLTSTNASLAQKMLFARWKTNAVEYITVNFKCNGGETDDVTTNVVKGAELGTAWPAVPTRTGYRFVGWYTGTATGNRVTKDTIVKTDRTFYARWSDVSIENVLGSFDGLAFSTTGWYADGEALRSGATSPSPLSALAASGTMTFSWKKTGGKNDYLEFAVHGQQIFRRNYEVSWTSQTETLPDSESIPIKWEYRGSTSKGAWIKNLTWSPTSKESPIAAWTNHPERAGLVFETGGTKPWTNDVTGVCIMTQPLADGEFSWVRTTICGRGTLSFKWRTDCEPGYVAEPSEAYEWTDRLELRVDGFPVRLTGGTSAEPNEVVQYDNGTHTYEWRYVKDDNTSVGADRAWLESVRWTPKSADGLIYLVK